MVFAAVRRERAFPLSAAETESRLTGIADRPPAVMRFEIGNGDPRDIEVGVAEIVPAIAFVMDMIAVARNDLYGHAATVIADGLCALDLPVRLQSSPLNTEFPALRPNGIRTTAQRDGCGRWRHETGFNHHPQALKVIFRPRCPI